MTTKTVALDALRGLAALLVFVHHAELPGFESNNSQGALIFFALSGYLLYGPFTRHTIDLRSYAVRRFLRITPAYLFAALAVSVASGHVDPFGIVTMKGGPILVVWTLMIEISFYVALPVIAWALRKTDRPELWICAGALASLLAGAVEMALLHTYPLGLPAWLWAFAPGMLLALPNVRARLANIPTGGIGIALLGLALLIDPPYPNLLASAGAMMLIASLLKHPSLGGRWAVAVGAVSYSVYLFHLPILDAIHGQGSWAGAGLALVLTVGIASLVYLAVERPAIRLGNVLDARKPGPAVASPGVVVAA